MNATKHSDITASRRITPRIQGSIVALITPMHPDGSIDYDAYRALIDWHAAEGTDAVSVAGTTGESATLSVDEQIKLIRVGVEHSAGRLPIIAGTGANSTREAIAISELAKQAGAAYGLSVAPYYNKPTQEGLYQHFRAVAESVDLPMLLYNVPSRTAVDISNETVLRLSQVSGIIGLKDATGDVGRGIALMREMPQSFSLYSGDDDTAAALMLMGAHGNISVTANVIPGVMKRLSMASLTGDALRVREIGRQIVRLNQALFQQTNPIPVKWLLAQMGKAPGAVRLPLTELMSIYRAELMEAMQLIEKEHDITVRLDSGTC